MTPFFLAVMLAALAPCRAHFYRKSSLVAERFSPQWTVAVLLVMTCAIWLAVFAYQKRAAVRDFFQHVANLFGEIFRRTQRFHGFIARVAVIPEEFCFWQALAGGEVEADFGSFGVRIRVQLGVLNDRRSARDLDPVDRCARGRDQRARAPAGA